MIFIRKDPYEGPKIIEMEEAEARKQIRKEFANAEPMGHGLMAWYNEAEKEGFGELGQPSWAAVVKGDMVITGANGSGLPVSVPDVDIALELLFKLCRYEQVDPVHNVWRCRHCGHLEQMEADGPFENGWNRCPECGRWILSQGEGEA